ncbi:hypothetical protein, partial [Yersinia enterocolitica]|uniref:hypothetical protein n=2 Tax=Enterobacterales TaxID=91347 RepID=UPI0033906964
QVVYVDISGNVLNRTAEDFFQLYSFHSVDGELERRLEALIQFNAADLAHVQDPEDDPVDGSENAGELLERAAQETSEAPAGWADIAGSGQSVPELEVNFGFMSREGAQPTALSPEQLSAALVMYSESPNREYSITEHRLMFRLGGDITLESLDAAFRPNSVRNTIDWFDVVPAIGDHKQVVWEAWIGVFPEYSVSGLYAAVIVGTPDREQPAQEHENKDAEEGQLVTDALENYTPEQASAEADQAAKNALAFEATVEIPDETQTADSAAAAILVQRLGISPEEAQVLAQDEAVVAAVLRAGRPRGDTNVFAAIDDAGLFKIEEPEVPAVEVEPAFSPETAQLLGLN